MYREMLRYLLMPTIHKHIHIQHTHLDLYISFIFIYIYIHTYIYTYVCTVCIYVYIRMCICRVCIIYSIIFVCMYVYMYVRVYYVYFIYTYILYVYISMCIFQYPLTSTNSTAPARQPSSAQGPQRQPPLESEREFVTAGSGQHCLASPTRASTHKCGIISHMNATCHVCKWVMSTKVCGWETSHDEHPHMKAALTTRRSTAPPS